MKSVDAASERSFFDNRRRANRKIVGARTGKHGAEALRARTRFASTRRSLRRSTAIQPGDQLRARGEKNRRRDGRLRRRKSSRAASVIFQDHCCRSIRGFDVDGERSGDEETVHRSHHAGRADAALPEMMAKMLAARLKGRAGRTGTAVQPQGARCAQAASAQLRPRNGGQCGGRTAGRRDAQGGGICSRC